MMESSVSGKDLRCSVLNSSWPSVWRCWHAACWRAALRMAVLEHKRATVVRLRDQRRIDDTVLRQVERTLDLEEVRLARRVDDD